MWLFPFSRETPSLKRSLWEIATSQVESLHYAQLDNVDLHNRENKLTRHSQDLFSDSAFTSTPRQPSARKMLRAESHIWNLSPLREILNEVDNQPADDLSNYANHQKPWANSAHELLGGDFQTNIQPTENFQLSHPGQVTNFKPKSLLVGHSNYPSLHAQAHAQSFPIENIYTPGSSTKPYFEEKSSSDPQHVDRLYNPQFPRAWKLPKISDHFSNNPFLSPSSFILGEGQLLGKFGNEIQRYEHNPRKTGPAGWYNDNFEANNQPSQNSQIYYPRQVSHDNQHTKPDLSASSLQNPFLTKGIFEEYCSTESQEILRDWNSNKVLEEKTLIFGRQPERHVSKLSQLPLPIWPSATGQVISSAGFIRLRPFQFLKFRLQISRKPVYPKPVNKLLESFDDACLVPEDFNESDFFICPEIQGFPIRYSIYKSLRTGRFEYGYLEVLKRPTVKERNFQARFRIARLFEKAFFLHGISWKRITGTLTSDLEVSDFLDWLKEKCFTSGVPIIGSFKPYPRPIQFFDFCDAQKLVIWTMASKLNDAADTAALSLVVLWYKEKRFLHWSNSFEGKNEVFWFKISQQLCIERAFGKNIRYWSEKTAEDNVINIQKSDFRGVQQS
ncbi:hypothetical protein O181_008099 [Austropuccinia psidii MF-1]|uniref:Uncharacterized protein n=1 Tax=Austropuccinia psidii MF-1 TaxID=1389203 RepID=A0A9Q3GIJ0_9BASI|nr:hypothetical protein [Austropuccinia psidii MF-1]